MRADVRRIPPAPSGPADPGRHARAARRAPGATALALLMGAHLGVVQLSYTFLLEAHLTSRTVSYFAALGCWLVGVLLGLWLRRPALFLPLLLAGTGAYYLAWAIVRARSFDLRLLPAALACVAASGLLAGYFFPWAAGRFARPKLLFLHENNGFLLGSVVSLVALVHAGERYLALAPGVAALLVAAAHLVDRRGAGGSA